MKQASTAPTSLMASALAAASAPVASLAAGVVSPRSVSVEASSSPPHPAKASEQIRATVAVRMPALFARTASPAAPGEGEETDRGAWASAHAGLVRAHRSQPGSRTPRARGLERAAAPPAEPLLLARLARDQPAAIAVDVVRGIGIVAGRH